MVLKERGSWKERMAHGNKGKGKNGRREWGNGWEGKMGVEGEDGKAMGGERG